MRPALTNYNIIC